MMKPASILGNKNLFLFPSKLAGFIILD